MEGRWIVAVSSAPGSERRLYNIRRGRTAHFLPADLGVDLRTLCGRALDSACDPKPGVRRCKRCAAKARRA